MAKILKKKFFEIDLPTISDKYEAYAGSIEELDNKSVKVDLTRQLRGKSVDMVFTTKIIDHKLVGIPKKLTLLPYFIKHMLHTGIEYVEDSFLAESKESNIIIKPFLITRKKVSRAVRRTLRNSAKNWLIDYAKTKTNEELFSEVLSNQLQKPLGLKLKKVYPLAICEIRVLEVKKPLAKKAEAQ
jgi:ribosomal protein S3AE